MNSPLSSQPAERLSALPREMILAKLEDYFGATPPAEAVQQDYTLWRCHETGLEFAVPPVPGSAPFYAWISSFQSYYPGFRWEYARVAEIIAEPRTPSTGLRVLDVGSGNGDFLGSLTAVPASGRVALDFNASAVLKCRELGFEAFCGTIEEAIAAGFLETGSFPFVTAFHCLEHVPDPLQFTRDLLRMLSPGGRVFLSTPYSPMSFESEWFDVMNHPPHHLTRWNLQAYQKLAELLGVQMRFFRPRVRTWRQALQTFCLRKYGAKRKRSALGVGLDLVFSTTELLRIWRLLRSRAAANGVAGSDLILVELTKSSET